MGCDRPIMGIRRTYFIYKINDPKRNHFHMLLMYGTTNTHFYHIRRIILSKSVHEAIMWQILTTQKKKQHSLRHLNFSTTSAINFYLIFN